MSDWYEQGIDEIQNLVAEATELPLETVQLVYAYLVDIGVIDYDIEKDVIREMYDGVEEE